MRLPFPFLFKTKSIGRADDVPTKFIQF